MSRKPNSLAAWQPSAEQVYAASLLAHGYTWQATAEEVGCVFQTIGRWLNIKEFRAMVDTNVQKVADQLDSQLVEGGQEMVALWRSMVRGEVQADDRRLSHIAPIIRAYFLSSVQFDDAPRNAPKGAPGLAVQFNIDTSKAGDGDTR